MKAVADSSALIHPAKVPEFRILLKETFEEIRIPGAVYDEISKGKNFGSNDVPVIENAILSGWIKVVKTKAKTNLPINLGNGEREAISLALKERHKINWLLMDDEVATKNARFLGLQVRAISYLPIFWAANRMTKPQKAFEMLDDLVKSGYRLRTSDYVAIKQIILENSSASSN